MVTSAASPLWFGFINSIRMSYGSPCSINQPMIDWQIKRRSSCEEIDRCQSIDRLFCESECSLRVVVPPTNQLAETHEPAHLAIIV